jgi:SPX domain protein involved in polyphosphate accumulation
MDAGSDDDEDSDDQSIDAIEDKWNELQVRLHPSRLVSLTAHTDPLAQQEVVAILVADVHDLALYTKLNFTGFMKIVKVCKRSSTSFTLSANCCYRNMMYESSTHIFWSTHIL